MLDAPGARRLRLCCNVFRVTGPRCDSRPWSGVRRGVRVGLYVGSGSAGSIGSTGPPGFGIGGGRFGSRCGVGSGIGGAGVGPGSGGGTGCGPGSGDMGCGSGPGTGSGSGPGTGSGSGFGGIGSGPGPGGIGSGPGPGGTGSGIGVGGTGSGIGVGGIGLGFGGTGRVMCIPPRRSSTHPIAGESAERQLTQVLRIAESTMDAAGWS
jgi:hypothetical protein